MNRIIAIIVLSLSLFSCNENKTQKIMTPFSEAPLWAQEAIWYQIFVERFHNGNKNNDPTLETMKGALIDEVPDTWSVTDWNHNWYEQEEWAKETGLDFYRTIQMRRYGGDLQGVMDKIPYLKSLGINAVYFNPLNDAPSLHKYDARHYHHIDVSFGNDRDGDMKLIAAENKDKPEEWVWTNADKLFLDLIKKMHENGIKVILDFSWNHTGTQFWAFQDVIKNGKESKYKDWFEIKSFDNSETKENEFDYDGWFGIKSLPEIKKERHTEKVLGHAFEGNIPDTIKQHIFDVCKRWMDPNNDGNVAYGIDGMRLDVAEHVPLGFWRDLRKHVRSINPDFYLVGENWWTKWPDELMDPRPWVQGDVFDAVMHYHWYKPTRAYINQGDDKINLQELYTQLDALYSSYKPSTQRSMMNLVSSHDSDRVLSAIANSNKYKYLCKPSENKNYYTGKPDELAYKKLKLLLFQQFTFLGAPHIWNGDEMGMWGADDPDNRKPMIWEGIDFKNESRLYPEQKEYDDKPAFNKPLFDYYSSLAKIRNEHKTLSLGSYAFIHEFVGQNVFAYSRDLDQEHYIVLMNAESSPKTLTMTEKKKYQNVFQNGTVNINKGIISLGEYSCVLLKEVK